MYNYMLRTATLSQLLGIPSHHASAATRYRISRNIQKHGLPPTYIIHGDADGAVGVEQADEVVGAMVGRGLTVEYERVHGEDHLFDDKVDYENERLYGFVMRYL
jgi:dipeptidyl aminopeptidase/acylaminoacyl peptidase